MFDTIFLTITAPRASESTAFSSPLSTVWSVWHFHSFSRRRNWSFNWFRRSRRGSCICSCHSSCHSSCTGRGICRRIRSRRWDRGKVELLSQKLFSSSCIPPLSWRACPLLSQSWAHFTLPGIQGERKGRVDGEVEAEILALVGQRLAEGQALRHQGRVHCISSHFHLFFWIMKIARRQECMLLFHWQQKNAMWQYKWRHLVAKIDTNASGTTLWPN